MKRTIVMMMMMKGYENELKVVRNKNCSLDKMAVRAIWSRVFTVKTPSTLYLSQETAMGQLPITKGVNGQTGTEVKFF